MLTFSLVYLSEENLLFIDLRAKTNRNLFTLNVGYCWLLNILVSIDIFKYNDLGYRVPIGRFHEILKYNDAAKKI